MDEGRPSRTAHRAAVLRAAHQIFDDPRVFDDPVALRIIGSEGESALRSDGGRFETPALRALRAFVVLRSRYAEDRLSDAVQRGIRQYVILGAGLDTFAYRHRYPAAALRTFEVDHPATQAWKRVRLRQAGIPIPDSMTFVPVDFETGTLADGLRRAGLEPHELTFFSWLGVTAYLTRESVMQTLEFVASSAPIGSEIVFSYVVSFSSLADRVAQLGEPWLTCFDPPALAESLGRMGFGHVEDLPPEEANRRYFAGRTDGLSVDRTGHLISARV